MSTIGTHRTWTGDPAAHRGAAQPALPRRWQLFTTCNGRECCRIYEWMIVPVFISYTRNIKPHQTAFVWFNLQVNISINFIQHIIIIIGHRSWLHKVAEHRNIRPSSSLLINRVSAICHFFKFTLWLLTMCVYVRVCVCVCVCVRVCACECVCMTYMDF